MIHFSKSYSQGTRIPIISVTLLLLVFSAGLTAYSQGANKKFSGKPRFITTYVGKAMVVDYLRKPDDNIDSIRVNTTQALIELSRLVNEAVSNPSAENKDYQVKDATKIGIINEDKAGKTLFYCDVGDAFELYNKKISRLEFGRRIQDMILPNEETEEVKKESWSFSKFIKMDHPFNSFPMRINFLFPFAVGHGFNNNLGIEVTNVWSHCKSVANVKFQISVIYMIHKESKIYERYLIPGCNIGISFNFLEDVRFNLKPYLTIGWNPTYFYSKCDSGVVKPTSLDNTWYLNTETINYGIDFEAWIKENLGISISIEQSKYLAAIFPDIYGNSKSVQLGYLTFKIGLLF